MVAHEAFAGSTFACEMLAELRQGRSPAAFEELVASIEGGAALVYPALKPRYCDTAALEFVRELRGLLKRRWGEAPTPLDAATLLDPELVNQVVASMATRVRS